MPRAFACAALLMAATAGNASAASATGGASPSLTAENPLTPAQQAIADKKYQLALREIAHPGYLSSPKANALAVACPFSLSPSAYGTSGRVAPMSGTFCAGQYGFVYTRAVEQEKPYWCGVAVIQVISDYAWGYLGATHKYSQSYISATWTHTGTSGTSTSAMIKGLNAAVGSRLPNGFVYSGVWHNNQLTGPRSGVEWHGLLRTDLSQLYQMPQAVSVSPVDPALSIGLSSWMKAGASRQNAGHWIDIYGWEGYWDGTLGPSVAYDDSGIYGSGGVKDSDPALNVYIMIKTYNPNHGTNGVVW